MKTQAIAMILIFLMISQTLSAPQGFRRFVGAFSQSHESNANRSSLRGRFAGKSVGFGRRFSRPFYTHMDKLEKDSDSDSDSDSDLEEDSEEPSMVDGQIGKSRNISELRQKVVKKQAIQTSDMSLLKTICLVSFVLLPMILTNKNVEKNQK